MRLSIPKEDLIRALQEHDGDAVTIQTDGPDKIELVIYDEESNDIIGVIEVDSDGMQDWAY